MRLFNKNNANSQTMFRQLGNDISLLFSSRNHRLVSPEAARVSWGLESMDAGDIESAENETNEVVSELKQTVGPEVWDEDLTEGQKDAAMILMAASGEPVKYAVAATSDVTDPNAIGDSGSVDVRNISQESYDQREIEKMLPISIAYNLGAARQDDAMEAMWPTISLTADQAGLSIEITRSMVHHYWTHSSQGAATQEMFGQQSLIDALIDSSILKNNATDIVPVYNIESGIFDEEVGSFKVDLDNGSVESGAIKFGVPFDLIAAGASSLTDPFGVKDMTDTIDSLVKLKTVYVKITNDAGVSSILPLRVGDFMGTQFLKANEGNERDTVLNWKTSTYTITGNTLDKDGKPAEALAAFRQAPYDNFVIMLKMSANGRLNLADAHGELSAGGASVAGFYRSVEVNGIVDLHKVNDPAEITAAKSKITSLQLIAFYPDARYANLNRRERGLIVRTDVRREMYTIRMQSPVTAIKPVTDTATGYNIDSAVQTTRAENTVAGIEELMNMDRILSSYLNSSNRTYPNNDAPGIGRYLVRPYYERKEINVPELINNMNSHTLADDLSTHLCLVIRDCFAKAMMISGWMAAQQCSSNGTKEKPTAVIVTDPRIAQYLYTKGDTRLLGDHYNAMPVVSNYLEFRDKIYVVPRRESSVQSPDGLNWGNMFWLPELVTNMPINRTGQISNEFTIQTRRRHVCHCPILIRIDLVDFGKAIDKKIPTAIVA